MAVTADRTAATAARDRRPCARARRGSAATATARTPGRPSDASRPRRRPRTGRRGPRRRSSSTATCGSQSPPFRRLPIGSSPRKCCAYERLVHDGDRRAVGPIGVDEPAARASQECSAASKKSWLTMFHSATPLLPAPSRPWPFERVVVREVEQVGRKRRRVGDARDRRERSQPRRQVRDERRQLAPRPRRADREATA